MAFCPNCGTETAGRFCPNCGTDMGVAAGAGSRPAWSSAGPSDYTPPAATGLSENAASALCYVLGIITGIIFLVLAPYNTNRNIRFHAWQSIFLSLGAMIIDWGLRIIIYDVLRFHILGWGFMRLVDLFWVGVWIYMIFSTYNGKKISLPIIGELALKQA